MTLTEIPTEQIAAATDVPIAVSATIAAMYLARVGPPGMRGRSWQGVLVLLEIALLVLGLRMEPALDRSARKSRGR